MTLNHYPVPGKAKSDMICRVDVGLLFAVCQARTDREDAQFDKYLALKDRPRPIEMLACREGDKLEPCETVDMDHWCTWFAENP